MSDALIVAHGQPSSPEPAESSLRDFAARVQVHAPEVGIHAATLAAPGALERMMETLSANTVIFPLFMAKGWFVTRALPDRLYPREPEILQPLGLDPKLPELAAKTIADTAAAQGWPVEEVQVVLAAHGSGRSRNPSAVALQFAEILQTHLACKEIRTGFVEEPPSIAEAAEPVGPVSICLPFFACRGGHATEDVPQALDEAGFRGILLPVLGELPPVPARIASQIMAHFAR